MTHDAIIATRYSDKLNDERRGFNEITPRARVVKQRLRQGYRISCLEQILETPTPNAGDGRKGIWFITAGCTWPSMVPYCKES